MGKIFYPDFFNDVFGPIMQPGSSGSFAGTSRVGRIARHTLLSEPKRVRILFNPGDHHMLNLGNMMDDRGYLGGLQDFATDDVRLFSAHELARKKKISYEFGELETDNAYPGSVHFELTGTGGDTASLTAKSVGGGMVATYEISGFPIHWRADTFGVLLQNANQDIPEEQLRGFEQSAGEAFLTAERVARPDGASAVFLELSENPEPGGLLRHFGPDTQVRVFPALLPVVTTAKRKPQLFKTVEEWRRVAEQRGISFVQAAIEYEKDFSGWTDETIWQYFENIADILNQQIHALETIGYDNAKDTPMLPIYGRQWNTYMQNHQTLSDPITRHILVHAFSTNAKLPGVRIVPGPMGTGGGYLFSALDAVREARGFSHRKMIEGLVVAAGLGALAYTHTNATGEVGCVGESGVCCAMASGAVTWMAGGDGNQVEHAASMALQANLGIPCDPIPGGLEFPCITRTIRAAVTAPLYADLALSGIDPLVPYHEVLGAIEKNFRSSRPGELCGPLCGINCTPTAGRCKAFLQNEVMGDKIKFEAEETETGR
ncbi:L-serine ammonia-lyase, iron-sulfur-dependent, subunit beta [Caproiciproducens sp. R1]|uniref:L-serine ammonia-lyase, iron-sulfur-dependent, subunit beta n=1 Tax=Caproiciproducens sp. R1 TaxID=3435000 RepID=UPI00403338C8